MLKVLAIGSVVLAIALVVFGVLAWLDLQELARKPNATCEPGEYPMLMLLAGDLWLSPGPAKPATIAGWTVQRAMGVIGVGLALGIAGLCLLVTAPKRRVESAGD